MTGIQRKAMHGEVQGNYNDWNYDSSCTDKLLPLWDLENFSHLSFVTQCTRMDRTRHDHICCTE